MSSASATSRPFIIDMPAPLTRRNPQLSKHARHLYQTMRGLSEGKSGALRIRGRWLKAKAIDAAAEMCRDLRMRAMRELVILGLVTIERERVARVIRGRRRVVLGCVHYIVHRQPVRKPQPSRPVLLQSISSTVEEIDSQFLPETPMGAGGVDLGVASGVSNVEVSIGHHHHQPKTDDDRRTPVSDGGRLDDLRKTALAKCEDSDGIMADALDIIVERAERSGVNISSPRYLEVALDRFDFQQGQDREELMQRRRRRGFLK